MLACYLCGDECSEARPAKLPLPCNCKGSIALHEECFIEVLGIPKDAGSLKCSVCKGDYSRDDAIIHKYEGVLIDPESIAFCEQTPQLCSLSVRLYGMALQHVDKKTYPICLDAVKSDGMAIKYVPREFINDTICRSALKSCGWAIQHIPSELMCDDYYNLAIAEDAYVLSILDAHQQTPARCFSAVQAVPEVIRYVLAIQGTGVDSCIWTPTQKQDICDMAIDLSSYVYQDIPDKYKTLQNTLETVHSWGMGLKYVPRHLLTYDVCKEAVSDDGSAIQYVPDAFMTPEIRGIAMAQVYIIDDNDE